jgi:hypothetical protein
MLRAIGGLDANRKSGLDKIWTEARRGCESRLTATPADLSGEERPTAIDYAAWPAIAGDHSTSAADMVHTILVTEWILDVASITAKLNAVLATGGLQPSARTNALRDSDLRLLRADPDYATRAGSNNVHFLLARPYTETDPQSYIETCLGQGCELNALGTYAWYHVSALRKAGRISRGGLTEEEKGQITRAALADEAFAIHFLQDAFAAGHVAGTRGDASVRKGTHDFYNEHGLEVRSWDGKTMVLKGDAWMRTEDAERTARAAQSSIEQLLDACEGKGPAELSTANTPALSTPDTLNVCELLVMPANDLPPAIGSLLNTIIKTTPVPGLSEGDGELPRFRSEVGPFIGIVPAVRGGVLFGGFGENQQSAGGIGGLEIAVRLGLGLDGVLNESGDGLVFLDLGLRLDAASSTSVIQSSEIQQWGSILAAIPSRGAFISRVRMPFWLIPFDLLITAPFIATTSPETYTRMAAVAANGGLIPWQAGMATSFGRFQFILGREVGVSFFGYVKSADRMLIPYGDPDQPQGVLANVRSLQLEFPFMEYMPFRTFSTDQSSALVIQFYTSVDIPTSATEFYPPGNPELNLRNVWQLGVRAAFRWRHYF